MWRTLLAGTEDSFRTQLHRYNSDDPRHSLSNHITTSSLWTSDDSTFMSLSQEDRQLSSDISNLARDFTNMGDAVERSRNLAEHHATLSMQSRFKRSSLMERQNNASRSENSTVIEKIWVSRRGHKGAGSKALLVGSGSFGDGNANAPAGPVKAEGPTSNQFVPGNSLYDWAPASKLGYRRPSALYRVDSRDSGTAHTAAVEKRRSLRSRRQARGRSAGRVLQSPRTAARANSRPVTPINDLVFSHSFEDSGVSSQAIRRCL